MNLLKTNNSNDKSTTNLSLWKVILLIFVPTSILTLTYILVGHLVQEFIPSYLLFFILALLVLFPVQLIVVLKASKKEYGKYSFRSAFSNYQKLSWWKVFIYGFSLDIFNIIKCLLIRCNDPGFSSGFNCHITDGKSIVHA